MIAAKATARCDMDDVKVRAANPRLRRESRPDKDGHRSTKTSRTRRDATDDFDPGAKP